MHLVLRHVGQIRDADLRFGDLTVLVGPQATGKSIALQFLKLVIDMGYVQAEMQRYGLDWSGELPQFFDAYFGEGMRSIWKAGRSEVHWEGKTIPLDQWIRRLRNVKTETLFYIPAQRVLALRDGWPRPFTDYSSGDPFAAREFSEKLRKMVDAYAVEEGLFPLEKRLKRDIRTMLEKTVFANLPLRVDKFRAQKRLVLKVADQSLPFMVWSAGQREFVPLLLGMYELMPPTKVSRRGKYEWAIIEEPEMGLHPRAVAVVLLMMLDLVSRGYRVCVSTHSPQILEAVWALRHLRENHADRQAFLTMFEAPSTPPMFKVAATALKADVKVHYFDPESGKTRDISELDPAEENGEAGWGGLSEFSSRANSVVARAVAAQESRT
jgi:hypothetical protein